MKKNKEHNHKKKYGQNFLEDNELLERIKEVSRINNTDYVIEIGPGLGYLTSMLLENSKKLIAFEIDKDLIPKLNKKFSNYSNFELINTDFMDYDLSQILNYNKFRVIANIPYYITSPIINKLIGFREQVEDIYLMVQKEVGERLIFSKNNSDRGVFTYILQFYAEVEYLFTVNKEMFDPIPKVDSAFIRIKPYKDKKYEKLINEKIYIKYIKASFTNKRKSLVNNLKLIGVEREKLENILLEMGKTVKARAEELTIEEYIELIKKLED